MSGKAKRRREYKRLVARAIGKEYERAMKLAKPRNVLYCSVCHGRLRLVNLPKYECRKCGRTYDMSEPPLPPEVNNGSEVEVSNLREVEVGGTAS